jgi:hypothetical protein
MCRDHRPGYQPCCVECGRVINTFDVTTKLCNDCTTPSENNPNASTNRKHDND